MTSGVRSLDQMILLMGIATAVPLIYVLTVIWKSARSFLARRVAPPPTRTVPSSDGP